MITKKRIVWALVLMILVAGYAALDKFLWDRAGMPTIACLEKNFPAWQGSQVKFCFGWGAGFSGYNYGHERAYKYPTEEDEVGI